MHTQNPKHRMEMEKGGKDFILPELLNLEEFKVSKHTFLEAAERRNNVSPTYTSNLGLKI